MYPLLIALLSLMPLMQGCGDQESPFRSSGTAAKLTASAVQVGSGQGGDIRFLRPPTYADSLANGLIGDEATDTTTAPPEFVSFVVSGTIANETGRDLSEVEIIAVWGVVTGSPDYSYIFGKTTPKEDGTFELVFDQDPPPEALNLAPDGGALGVAYIVAVLASEATRDEGILAEDYDFEGMTVGGATRHCVIFTRNFTAEDDSRGAWVRLFNGYGVGRGKEIEDSQFEGFEAVDPGTVEIIIDSLENFRFVNWS